MNIFETVAGNDLRSEDSRNCGSGPQTTMQLVALGISSVPKSLTPFIDHDLVAQHLEGEFKGREKPMVSVFLQRFAFLPRSAQVCMGLLPVAGLKLGKSPRRWIVRMREAIVGAIV